MILLVSVDVAPPRRFYWSGHEAVYGAILRGEPPPTDEVGWATTAPMRGLATVLRWTLGGWGEPCWLWLQRLAAAASPIFIWLALRRWAPLRAGIAAGVGAFTAILLLSPAFLRWSATGYGLSIAWALALLCVAAAAEGRWIWATLLGALAVWMRPETVSIPLFAVVLAADRPGLPAATRRVPVLLSGAVLALVGVGALGGVLGAFGPVLGGLPPLELMAANSTLLTGMWPDGRLPIFLFAALLWSVLLRYGAVGRAPATRVPEDDAASARRFSGFVLAFPVAALAPLLVVDAGSRHFVPLDLLAAIAAAMLVAELAGDLSRARRVLFAVGLLGASACVHLWQRADGTHPADRYGGDHRALREGLPLWPLAALADATKSGERVVLVPQGVLPGSVDFDDALAATERTLSASCVVLAVGSAWAYTGDARGERVDRLIQHHDLVPLARIDDAPADGPWVVFGPRPKASAVGSSVPPPLCYPPRPDASPSLSIPFGRRRRAD